MQNLVGKLQILSYSDDIEIVQHADDKDIIFKSDDGSGGTTTYLRIDGGAEIMKAGKNLRFNDNVQGTFGTSDDLKIYHDSNNSYIENSTGGLYIMSRADDADLVFMCDEGSGS